MHLLHAADLHLDRPFEDLQAYPSSWADLISQAPYMSLQRMVDAALADQVDAILLAGDLYHGENPSVTAQHFFIEQMKRLNDQQIPAFIIHGNHDPLQADHLVSSLPACCHVFSTDPETVYFTTATNKRVAVTGFSYPQRWEKRAILRDFPSRKSHVDYHIGLYHGQLYQAGGDNVYAPFSLADIDRLNYDYLALGHIHAMTRLKSQMPAYYAGTLCGRSKNERGPKGYLDVIFEGEGVQVNPIAVSPVEWMHVEVDGRHQSHWQDLLEISLQQVKQQKLDAELYFLSLDLQLPADLAEDQLKTVSGPSFYELLKDQLQGHGVWLFDLIADKQNPDGLQALQQLFPQEYAQAKSKLLEDQALEAMASPLFEDSGMRKWLKDWDWIAEFRESRSNHYVD